MFGFHSNLENDLLELFNVWIIAISSIQSILFHQDPRLPAEK
jgi:hypothetical protein